MLSFLFKSVQTDGRTKVKQYAPDLLKRGHKNSSKVTIFQSKLLTPIYTPKYGEGGKTTEDTTITFLGKKNH